MSINMNKIEEIEDDLRMAKEAAVRVHHTLGLPLGELTLAIFSRIGAEKGRGDTFLRASDLLKTLAPAPAAPGSQADAMTMLKAVGTLPLSTVAVCGGLDIRADQRSAEYGNASHYYEITDSDGIPVQDIRFQIGPVKECGVNGIQNEQLLAIVIDRLEGFQAGPFACEENALALKSCIAAFEVLNARTADREARGVEGTSVK